MNRRLAALMPLVSVLIVARIVFIAGNLAGPYFLGTAATEPTPTVAIPEPEPSPMPTQNLTSLIYAASSNAADLAEGRAIRAVQTAEAGWQATEAVLWPTREARIVRNTERAVLIALTPLATTAPATVYPDCAEASAGELCVPEPFTPTPWPACSTAVAKSTLPDLCRMDGD